MDKTWKCTICGVVDGGISPPAHCSECGARDAMFVESEEPPHGIAHNPIQPRDERDQTSFAVGPGRGCVEED
ncbi:MAG TPA: hypothetical protein VH328_05650 [Burkholderiaceae bacterium]|nr:hypothetical protein [Burkholderiaceae bacterium]